MVSIVEVWNSEEVGVLYGGNSGGRFLWMYEGRGIIFDLIEGGAYILGGNMIEKNHSHHSNSKGKWLKELQGIILI